VEVLYVGRADDPTTVRLLEALRGAGHGVRVGATAGEAELAARSARVDAAIVESDPAPLRRRLGDIPVAAWLPAASTAKAAELLEAGADEVLHPGMGDREQLARLAALGRRAPGAEPAVELGPLRVDRDRGEATWHGRRLQLTRREREVLHVLAAAGGATVRREALYRGVWGYAMARGDRTVDVNVKRLREKLGASVGPPLAIETEPGVGYRLVVAEPAVTAL
jgi:DNA-binding response OmpR family regulator